MQIRVIGGHVLYPDAQGRDSPHGGKSFVALCKEKLMKITDGDKTVSMSRRALPRIIRALFMQFL